MLVLTVPQPLLDMANHTCDARQECSVRHTPLGGLELVSPPKTRRTEALAAGAEVCITYGAHSSGVSVACVRSCGVCALGTS